MLDEKKPSVNPICNKEKKWCERCGKQILIYRKCGPKEWASRRFCGNLCRFPQTHAGVPRYEFDPKYCVICNNKIVPNRPVGPKRWAKRKYCSVKCQNDGKQKKNQSPDTVVEEVKAEPAEPSTIDKLLRSGW